MTDKLSPARRSANMSKIRSTDSAPELKVRRLAFKLGYRYRLHRADLPGKPDLVFAGLKKVIFVHGCFWHQHKDCREGRVPGSNKAYWTSKLQRNVRRDVEAQSALKAAGWSSLVIWECQTTNEQEVRSLLQTFFAGRKQS
jgi:DNA mismatch endonuclease (patch repair protein)